MPESDYINFPLEPTDVCVPDVRVYVAGMAVAGYVLDRTITYADANYIEEVRFDDPEHPDRERLVYSGASVGFEHDAHEDVTTTLRNDIVCRLAAVYTLKLLDEGDTSEIRAEDDKYFVPRCEHEYLFCTQVPRYCELTGVYDDSPFGSPASMTAEEEARYMDWLTDREDSVVQGLWEEAGRIVRENKGLIASLAVGLMEHGYLFGPEIHEGLACLEAQRHASN